VASTPQTSHEQRTMNFHFDWYEWINIVGLTKNKAPTTVGQPFNEFFATLLTPKKRSF
jgi:hypothetical protein